MRDAVILYEDGGHANAVGLAMLVREEMGKGRMLLALWREVVDGRQRVTAATCHLATPEDGREEPHALSALGVVPPEPAEAKQTRQTRG